MLYGQRLMQTVETRSEDRRKEPEGVGEGGEGDPMEGSRGASERDLPHQPSLLGDFPFSQTRKAVPGIVGNLWSSKKKTKQN